MDFGIALLLFIFTLVVYFSYTNNLQKQEQGELDAMISDAKLISSALALSGYPADWDNTTVVRLGLADQQKVNVTKVKNFKNYDYKTSRRLFGTVYEYAVFFVNNKGEVLNINGVCTIGNPLVNVSYNIKSAYYYQDEDDSFLKDFMNNTFKADIYFGDVPSNQNDIDALISNISKYQFIMMEHPLLSGGEFGSNKAKFENYSSSGGLLMISGELASPSTNTMVGVDFKKKSGQSSSQRTAIINNTDPYLTFTVGQSMAFDQYYYVINNSDSSEFLIIGTFNQTGDNAIARWKYGNGTTYFFSDFDVSYFNGNFVGVVEEAAQGLIEGTCTPVNMTDISQKKLVKAERYLNYNSKVARMIVYVWR
ncbi:hypothetical protein HYX02_01410 [Candidatus Woesearchaeota archaeon]|nr:hypothetical protein [Candidatus Woesearchaeota archaeon]